MKPTDHKIRTHALNTKRSFIVRAPAGSGKTHLLIERFLHTLSKVDEPEQILAITFTRKAAAEMRDRIIRRLEDDDPLILDIKKRAAELHWRLKEMPQRLQIMTIDGFCHQLTQEFSQECNLPLNARLSDQPVFLYQEAIHQLMLKSRNPDCLNELLMHQRGNLSRIQHLFSELLSNRDQWLNRMLGDQEILIQKLSEHFAIIREEWLKPLSCADDTLRKECLDLIQRMQGHLFNLNLNDPICSIDLQTIFTPPINLDHWQCIASLLQTRTGTWRSRFTKREGVPPHDKTLKEDLTQALENWPDAFRKTLAQLSMIPTASMPKSEIHLLKNLNVLLPELYGHLKVAFHNHRAVDFIEVTQAAHQLLSNPTHAAADIHHRIHHIMIDEFQDTAPLQFQLIQSITEHWVDHHRTLFLVGDPMQSIYRFRQADVRLFLQLFESGHPHLDLEALTLEVNFRSDGHLIHSSNTLFKHLFPKELNLNHSAIAHQPAHPSRPLVHPVSLYYVDGNHHAQTISELCQKLPEGSIAVLTRTRAQLNQVATCLRKQNIPFNGIDLIPLLEQPVGSDLLNLLTALLDPYHRAAWLSVLRGPIIGLAPPDLILLSQQPGTLWKAIQTTTQTLSEHAQTQLNLIIPIFEHALTRRFTTTHDWFWGIWQLLNGPMIYSNEDQPAVVNFFKTLKEYDRHALFPLNAFRNHLQALFFSTNNPQARIHLMTVHKSKGLEFDHVLLPFLHENKRPPSDALFVWDDYFDQDQRSLPLVALGLTEHPHARTIRWLSQQKDQYENKRLLYVGMTRAKNTCHLITTKKCPDSSWGGMIQSALELMSQEAHHFQIQEIEKKAELYETQISQWITSYYPQHKGVIPQTQCATKEISWEPQADRLLGEFIHKSYTQLTKLQKHQYYSHLMRQHQRACHKFKHLHVNAKLTHWAQAINLDPIYYWMYEEHPGYKDESTLIEIQSEVKEFRTDRTFFYENQRWIIDIKTAICQTKHIQQFLMREWQEHKHQLENYHRIYNILEPGQSIRLMLYFPLVPIAIHWQLGEDQFAIYECSQEITEGPE